MERINKTIILCLSTIPFLNASISFWQLRFLFHLDIWICSVQLAQKNLEMPNETVHSIDQLQLLKFVLYLWNRMTYRLNLVERTSLMLKFRFNTIKPLNLFIPADNSIHYQCRFKYFFMMTHHCIRSLSSFLSEKNNIVRNVK